VRQNRSKQTETENQQDATAGFQNFSARLAPLGTMSTCGSSDNTYYAQDSGHLDAPATLHPGLHGADLEYVL
jgi:hypothetical protein